MKKHLFCSETPESIYTEGTRKRKYEDEDSLDSLDWNRRYMNVFPTTR